MCVCVCGGGWYFGHPGRHFLTWVGQAPPPPPSSFLRPCYMADINGPPGEAGAGILRGAGMIFFLGGGGKSVDMPSDCQILGGGAQAYPSHWDKKLGGGGQARLPRPWAYYWVPWHWQWAIAGALIWASRFTGTCLVIFLGLRKGGGTAALFPSV